MLLGLTGEGLAWWLVRFRAWNVWRLMAPVLVAMGLAAVAASPPPLSPEVRPALGATVGVLGGVALYAATRAFAAFVRPWAAFRRQSVATYGRRGSLPLATVLLLSVALMVPGEELFWRGLFQVELAEALGGRSALAAVASWGAFVLANLPSANLAIVAGALVGGAAWTLLGWWSGGVLAPLLSHGVWTALMLSLPVVRVDA